MVGGDHILVKMGGVLKVLQECHVHVAKYCHNIHHTWDNVMQCQNNLPQISNALQIFLCMTSSLNVVGKFVFNSL